MGRCRRRVEGGHPAGHHTRCPRLKALARRGCIPPGPAPVPCAAACRLPSVPCPALRALPCHAQRPPRTSAGQSRESAHSGGQATHLGPSLPRRAGHPPRRSLARVAGVWRTGPGFKSCLLARVAGLLGTGRAGQGRGEAWRYALYADGLGQHAAGTMQQQRSGVRGGSARCAMGVRAGMKLVAGKW